MKLDVDPNDLRFALGLLAHVEELVAQLDRPETDAARQLSQALFTARSSLLRIAGASVTSPVPSMDPMKTALRVLTAYAGRTVPEPADLDTLVRVCGRKPAGMGWDEFACETLQKVLKDRAIARETLAVGASASRA